MLPFAVHNVSLVYAIVWAIDHYYGQSTSTALALVQFATSAGSRGYHNDLIDATLDRASGAGKIQFLLEDERMDMTENLDELPPPSGVTGRPSAIWFLDSLRAYIRLERYLLQPGSAYKRNGYFIIVYTGREAQPLETIKIMFRRLLNIYVLNVNVFLTRRGIVQMYTYYPYGPHRCQSSLPVYYGSFQGVPSTAEFGLRRKLFPSKLTNMHGCELIAVTFEHRPYVRIDDDANSPNGRRLHGIEGMIFNSLAERMNFTINLVERQDKDRGQIMPNGSVTGILQMILEGEANITFVCFMYSKERSDVMLPSISYTNFPIVLVIPGGGTMKPLERLMKPFRYIIWSCLIVSLLIGLSLIAVLQLLPVPAVRELVLGRSNRLPCLGLWYSLLGGLALHTPRRNFSRYLLVMWLLETLVLRAAYTGQLYLILQDAQVRTPLQSMAEVVAKGYAFYMLPALRGVFRDSLLSSNIRVVRSHEASLLRLRDEDDPGIAVPLLLPTVYEFDYLSGPTRRHLTVLPDALMTAPLTLYMRPHSYLKRRIDRLLMAMMSSGIIYRYRRMYLDRIERMAKRRSAEPQPLTIVQLSGIFFCLMVLQLLAGMVFVLERLALRHSRFRRALDVANRYVA
ncbi:uncharacterized protein LOC117903812 [Drosophila subobscura]|uniref:uncharacterized protein LOC117903812 n=1 Tax=Drosophila subobscura TaxID=7241 RepID=UPI00155A215B|nr:uncharacterized protein LOC117903812 [Drosophila subobscura]